MEMQLFVLGDPYGSFAKRFPKESAKARRLLQEATDLINSVDAQIAGDPVDSPDAPPYIPKKD